MAAPPPNRKREVSGKMQSVTSPTRKVRVRVLRGLRITGLFSMSVGKLVCVSLGSMGSWFTIPETRE